MNEKELKFLGIERGAYLKKALSVSLLAGIILSFAGILAGLAAFLLSFCYFLFYPRLEIKKRTDELESSLPFNLRIMGMRLIMGVPFSRCMVEIPDLPSLKVKRARTQIRACFESGSSGKEILKIADDLLDLERNRLKEYSSKSAIFGLLLIVSSAVLPTFYLIYVSAGSIALDPISEEQIAIAMYAVFPLCSVAVLFLSIMSAPRNPFSRKMSFFVFVPSAITVVAFLAGMEYLSVFALAAAGFLIWKHYPGEKRIEDIEAALPDALLTVSSLPRSSGIERILRTIEKGEFGELSGEAQKSGRQIAQNVGFGMVLEDLYKRNRSPMLERACRMMKEMLDTSSLDRMSFLADDIMSFFQLKREHANAYSMQKYTLMLGVFLVPMILKMTMGLMENFDPSLDFGGFVPPYVMIYASIASAAISYNESRPSMSPIYLVIFGLAGLATFYLVF